MTARGSRHTKRVVALVAVLAAYAWARLPALTEVEAAALAGAFRFEAVDFPRPPGDGARLDRQVRPVNPALERISAWISTVGAAVALNDLDGDGLANDACLVDVRTDEVILAPVPGTGARYQPFSLSPRGLPYDPSTMAPMGCLPGDFNEDGWADLLVYYWGRSPVLYLRAGGGTTLAPPSYLAAELAPRVEIWNTNAATQADLDGDGHVDLIFGNYFQDGARILDTRATSPVELQDSMSRAFNGGRNRIFLWAQAGGGARPHAHFSEARGVWSAEVERAWTLAVGAADLDGDALPELYFANDFGPDRLLHNRSTPGRVALSVLEGERTFTTPRSKILGRDSFKGMGVDFGDLDGDGALDIYVSNIAAEYALQESHFLWLGVGDLPTRQALMKRGVAPFRDASEDLGLSRSTWAWDSRLADLNNDGVLEALQAAGFFRGTTNRWPELQELATGNDQLLRHVGAWPTLRPGDDLSGGAGSAFFVRAGSGRYHDVASQLGLGTRALARGIATADVDADGDLDLAVANQWGASQYLQNTGTSANTFVGLRLLHPIGERSFSIAAGPPRPEAGTRPAIGAEARIVLPGGATLVGQVDGGNGHSGKRSPDLHFGLGAIPRDRTLTLSLRWRGPAGEVQTHVTTIASGWHTIILGRKP